MKAWQIIEALDDPSGLIHRDKHNAFQRGTHPLSKHPSYPAFQPAQGDSSASYDEMLANKQWKKLLEKGAKYFGKPLTKRDFPEMSQKLMQAIGVVEEAEAQHKEELEALAIEIAFELPEFKAAKAAYEAGRLAIQANIVAEPDMTGTETTNSIKAKNQYKEKEQEDQFGAEDEPAQKAQRTPAEQDYLNKTVQRRHLTNAFAQGAAISNNFAFEMGGAALDRIHPGLRKAYGIVMVCSELPYWAFPDSAVQASVDAKMQGGTVKVERANDEDEEEAGEEEEQRDEAPKQKAPKIVAQGKWLPVLIHELIKGLVDITSSRSLPTDPDELKEILDITDLVDVENWHMLVGPQLWDKFIAYTDAENGRELAMGLYMYLQTLDADKFHEFIRELYSETPKGKMMLKQALQKVKEANDREANGGEDEGTGYNVEESASRIIRHMIE
jgi:hypothetical protein